MEKKSEPAGSAGAAPLGAVKESVHSDLQYVSIQVDGNTYGGWYRVLPDGQMELLALANMHCERRTESTPVEQARGMLADFIRGARRKVQPNESPASSNDQPSGAPGTLGGLLYADPSKTRVSERDWVGLLQSVAAGDSVALRELYERAHRVVFTLLVRLTNDRAVAEELTLDVFHDVWRRASKYELASGPVLGWIMNHARSKAIDHWGLDWGARRAIAAVGENREQEDEGCWSTDLLSPSPTLWERVAGRLALTPGGPVSPGATRWIEPEWENVAPGISCKLLATDAEKHVVTMLVRLAPGIDYPPHTHAGVEELHLLQGELGIDDRTLSPGDYNRAEPGSADKRVWSDTGCMCFLITSLRDVVG